MKTLDLILSVSLLLLLLALLAVMMETLYVVTSALALLGIVALLWNK